ncbi:Cytochrome P450 [Saccharopolyspora kobensis]|uniref:Cytochrome P450 n=1 Tax=Saccharopolyspora kobensis TaxID=146035 RepID=A0A1H5WQ74_9PSEU|nr:cytochrome P450 [Saccharopolyspora kobensis]SEG01574.1 Cytochrome P450 [Saccharopolyspora kobensis]SFD78313.1 Cytochrome P450 [Saccharopolyspora kobensis]
MPPGNDASRAATVLDGLPVPRGNAFGLPTEFARSRDRRPIYRMVYPDGHVGWLVTGYSAARAVLTDHRFSAEMHRFRFPVPGPGSDPAAQQPGALHPGIFQAMDPPEHTRYRRLLAAKFTTRRMHQLEAKIEQVTAEQLDQMQRQGPPADLVSTFAMPIPSQVIRHIVGAPDSDWGAFHRHVETMIATDVTFDDVAAVMRAVPDFLRDLVLRKRRDPGDDVLSDLIATGELDDDELVGLCWLLLENGYTTTANMLALGTLALLVNPEQLAALRADPSLADKATEELLRYITIFQFGLFRAAREDVELAGHLIKAGDAVTVLQSTANRDPAHFTDPDRLDLTRPATGHLSFGHGIHICLGQHLARAEMRIAHTALLRRFPSLHLAATPDELSFRTSKVIYGVHRLPVSW